MNKFEINELLDQYIGLLTKKEQEICEEYYRNDLSYQEIAEETGVSRSAVYDMIKRSKEELMRYEEILHCNSSQHHRRKIYEEILKQTEDTKVIALVNQLIQFEEENYE